MVHVEGRFVLKFDTVNDVFVGLDAPLEIGRILRETAISVEAGFVAGTVVDVNGNIVGNWEWEAD